MPEVTDTLPAPQVTLYLDGLITLCFTEERCCQLGLYTNFEDHFLELGVLETQAGAADEPTRIRHIARTAVELKEAQPLWLYLNYGAGREPQRNAAAPARFPAEHPKSFTRVLDFEGTDFESERGGVEIQGQVLSLLNIAQGAFFTAQQANFLRYRLDEQGHRLEPPVELQGKATLIGAELEIPRESSCQLELAGATGSWLEPVPLRAGRQYQVYLKFAPEPPTGHAHHPPSHFPRFYSAVKPFHGRQYDIVEKPGVISATCPHFPPCTVTQLSQHTSLR